MAENETVTTNEETNSDTAGIDNLKVLENIEIKCFRIV
jgi:hypothetical protein